VGQPPAAVEVIEFILELRPVEELRAGTQDRQCHSNERMIEEREIPSSYVRLPTKELAPSGVASSFSGKRILTDLLIGSISGGGRQRPLLG